MTSFYSPVPVTHALWVAPKEMGLHPDWVANPGNGMQEMAVRLKKESLALAETLTEDQLMTKASDCAVEVNEWMAVNGFPDVKLQDIGSGLDFLYAAAILKLMGKFLVPGVNGYTLKKIGKPAFRLPKEAGIRFFEIDGKPVVEIPTDSGISLLVTAPTGVEDYNMVEDWRRIIAGMKQTSGNGIVLPKASIKGFRIDVSAMKGMTDGDFTIQEAIMAANFSLTHIKFVFDMVFAYSAKRCMDPDLLPEQGDYVADHPLYFALARRGHVLPLGVGIIDAKDLSNEKEL